jgi:hypothetical protein
MRLLPPRCKNPVRHPDLYRPQALGLETIAMRLHPLCYVMSTIPSSHSQSSLGAHRRRIMETGASTTGGTTSR